MKGGDIMSILKRFKTIMAMKFGESSSEKIVNQHLKQLDQDLRNVKVELSTLISDEQRAQRAVAECRADMDKFERYARKSLEEGREDEARKFLEKKTTLAREEVQLQSKYEMKKQVAEQLREMHDKLASDLQQLETRRSLLTGMATAAETQKKINEMGSPTHAVSAELDRMEENVDRAKYEAEAMAELTKESLDEKQEPDESPSYETADDALQKLKEELQNNKEYE